MRADLLLEVVGTCELADLRVSVRLSWQPFESILREIFTPKEIKPCTVPVT
jgi:hypothetical protein